MALIPGSYARAAGLQSEINKVTVTRVAGSEVQFRRAIDTYQRDLRYHVNHIQREQKNLRRSMRKYYKKLRESKKEREQRQAQLQEKKAKGKEAHGVKLPTLQDNLDIIHQNTEPPPGSIVLGASAPAGDGAEGQTDPSPDSPDSGIGVDADSDVTTAISGLKRKTFLTSTKSKAYLKAKGSQKNPNDSRGQKGQHKESDAADLTETDNDQSHDQQLPAIAEELEEDADPLKNSSVRVTFDVDTQHEEAVGKEGAENKHQQGTEKSDSKPKPAVQPIAVVSINTKPASKLVNDAGHGPTDVTASKDGTSQEESGAAATLALRKRRRKTEVSFGDLIKLQHTPTSSTKQLFHLVDRMASKHGIVDPPPESAASKSSSLDPRTNIKIKRRGDGPESLMSDGMVKHAAVLYSMKYGYHVPEELLPDLDLAQSTAHMIHDEWGEERRFDGGGYESDRTDGTELAASTRNSRMDSRKNSTAVSITLDSRGDAVSTLYAFSDVESFVTTEDTLLADSATAHLSEKPESRIGRSRGRQRQKLSISELSDHVSRIRSQFHERKDSNAVDQHPAVSRSLSTTRIHDDDSRAIVPPPDHTRQKLSPLPQRSRSLSRSRRESVSSQLQERLNDQTHKGVAWQSAFGRLKMLHTLVDLTPHFDKD